MNNRHQTFAIIVALGLTIVRIAAADAPPLAVVDGTEISREQFEREVYSEARQTFYHGRAPGEAQYLKFRQGIADKLIDKALLLEEAKRRGIEADYESVAAKLAVYADRYGETERWQSEGEQMLAKLRKRFEEDSVLDILTRHVKASSMPDEAVMRRYYDEHRDKFTQPEQVKVSLILLAVAPSSTTEVWQAARDEAAGIVRRLNDGADFGELARMHSADPSASNGGDMGYLHAGMLGDTVTQAIGKMAIGELTEPLTVLEGIAVFQLTGRKPAALQPFAAVRQRAIELWQHDTGESIWDQTLSDLRAHSDIRIDADYLRSLPVLRE